MPLLHLARYTLSALAALWALWAGYQSYQVGHFRHLAEWVQEHPEKIGSMKSLPIEFSAASRLSCYEEKYKWISLYHLYAAEAHLMRADLEHYDEALHHALAAARQQLRCEPASAKAWLNFALILSESEGLTDEVQQAVVQSAKLSPNEAWLAEWRIPMLRSLMALSESPELKAVMVKDVDTIEHAYQWRKQRLYKKLGITDKSELIGP